MTQRDTVTVAVLFMKPAFVTTPRNDMGGMLSKIQRCFVLKLTTAHRTKDRLPFWGVVCLSLLLIDNLPTLTLSKPVMGYPTATALLSCTREPGYRGFLTGTLQIWRCGPSIADGRLSDIHPRRAGST